MNEIGAENRPNILWFCADQMRYDTISALGNAEINTPNIDRLMKIGTTFEKCYVQNQICTPSRASFLTGRYPAAHRVYRNGNAYFPKSEKLVTKTLAESGYDCGLIGKLHLSTASKFEQRPDDGYRLFEWCQNPGWEKVPGSNAYWTWLREKGEDPTKMFPGKPPYLSVGVPAELHQMAWVAERSIQFMQEDRDGPWMLSLNPFDPHPPFNPPPEAMDRFGDGQGLEPPLFKETDIAHQERFFDVRTQKRVAVNPLLTPEERAAHVIPEGDERGAKPPERFDGLQVKAAYYAMIENLDTQFGRILDHLEATGEIDNTIIVFTSDHGEMLGDHGLLYKGCRFFEGLIRVPLIMTGPGIPQDKRSDVMAESIDIAPTLLSLAGIEVDKAIQGMSFTDTVFEGADFHKETVVTDFNDSLGTSEVTHDTRASMTCDGRHKLVVYHSHPGLGELFDLQEDPNEFNCLWDDPDYAELKAKLIARHLDRMMGTLSAGPERVAAA